MSMVLTQKLQFPALSSSECNYPLPPVIFKIFLNISELGAWLWLALTPEGCRRKVG